MGETEDILKAKEVLLNAGYLCVHIAKNAAWTLDLFDLSMGRGIAVELTPVERRAAEQRMLKIKRDYGHDC